MKNIGKIATSFLAVLLFGCTVENANAAAVAGAALRIAEGIHLGGADGITPLDGDNNPVLVAGSDEEALFKALETKGIHLLMQHDVVAAGVKGLNKYLSHLIATGVTVDFVRENKIGRIRADIQNQLSREINEQYHNAATVKADEVRAGINQSTACLNAIAEATINIGLAGNLEDVRHTFLTALNAVEVALGDGGLKAVIGNLGNRGKSGVALDNQRRAILRLKIALVTLVNLAINRLQVMNASTVKMELFHAMYEIFCSKYLGEDEFFETYEELDPPTQENGNKSFESRYREWANSNHTPIPVNGCSLH